MDFPSTAATTLTGINKCGTIVGNWTDGNGHSHAFRLKNGTFIQLKPAGASDIYAESISDTGAIVGWYANSSAAVYINGFVWQNGVLRTVDHPNGTTMLWDINAKGIIVGDNDGRPEERRLPYALDPAPKNLALAIRRGKDDGEWLLGWLAPHPQKSPVVGALSL